MCFRKKSGLSLRAMHLQENYEQKQKDADIKACNFIKKRLQHRYFPVSIVKFPYKMRLVAASVWWNERIFFFTLTSIIHHFAILFKRCLNIHAWTWFILESFLMIELFTPYSKFTSGKILAKRKQLITSWQCQSFEWFLFNTTFHWKKFFFE